MSSGIYMIKNHINNKVYIGKTNDINRRLRDHRYTLRHNKHPNRHLQYSWNKYGEDAFTFEKLEYCEEELLNPLERLYIAKYNALDYNYGYNKRPGGDDCGIGEDNPRYKDYARVVKNNKARGQTYAIVYKTRIIKTSKYPEYLEQIVSLINKGYDLNEAVSQVPLPNYNRKNPPLLKGTIHPNYREDIPDAQQLYHEYSNGLNIPELAKKYCCGTSTIHRRLQKAKQELTIGV